MLAEKLVKRQRRYLSYLLRLWQSGQGKEAVWRASLESPLSGERLGFATLKDLFAFLETQAKSARDQDDKEGRETADQGKSEHH